ncbi:MAG: flavodoxin-dependent (E)-4-hydroxy-3-methylbut-2-enyl-diphosphate synthase [Clostridia bacterium]|nr:flavodoxin-dependent (E)-4-hydroxy-3-methylbut-2-enyl-diphosphate synthase [Clostridia bacterium]MBQ7047387.1 flavodoxin-dependent (E)-4-hydroxy-3-methylbut-2-enyl-diphosphate synthase [Clostridia bacterium]
MSKQITVRGLKMGGGAPVSIQSMLNTPSEDKEACLEQLRSLEECGCDIVRMAFNSKAAAKTLEYLLPRTKLPLVADIHFDYKLALLAAEVGVSKIRINPGNIGSNERIKAVADICRQKNIPIRIGINGGSLEKRLLEKYGAPTAEAIAESAVYNAELLRNFDFDNIVLSVKSSNVKNMIAANRILAQQTDYPLHLGVTETGTGNAALVKSAIGIGSLLAEGIGDTVRVSLSEKVEEEVAAAKTILKSLGLRKGINLISCPTCGRTGFDLISKAKELESVFCNIPCDKNIDVALMGCIVNGPGEAKEADIGAAGAGDEAVIFRKGEIIRRVPIERITDALTEELERLLKEDT